MKRILYVFVAYCLIYTQCFGGMIIQKFSSAGGGTISFVSPNGSTSATQTGSNDLVINVPSGVSDGDIMYVALVTDQDFPWAVTSGWTQVDSQVTSSSSRTTLFYRVASSEPASYTFSFTDDSPIGSSGVIAAFEKTSGTWDAVQSTNTSSNTGSTITSGSVTSTDSSFLVIGFCSDDGVSQGSVSGMTNAGYVQGSSTGAGIWYESITTGQAETRTWTPGSSGDHASVATVLEAE